MRISRTLIQQRNFKEGWAGVFPMRSTRKAHYFKRDGVGFCYALCMPERGYPAGDMCVLEYNDEKCKRCQAALEQDKTGEE